VYPEKQDQVEKRPNAYFFILSSGFQFRHSWAVVQNTRFQAADKIRHRGVAENRLYSPGFATNFGDPV
jgi:hypothetical protein